MVTLEVTAMRRGISRSWDHDACGGRAHRT